MYDQAEREMLLLRDNWTPLNGVARAMAWNILVTPWYEGRSLSWSGVTAFSLTSKWKW